MIPFLVEMFEFNTRANQKMVDDLLGMKSNKQEAICLISHLINSQNKWLSRIDMYPNAPQMHWWVPEYPEHELKVQLVESAKRWIPFLQSKAEEEIDQYIPFIGYDGDHWSAKLKDIALQLVFHSFHHRAQIQTLIRADGLEPRFIDFIGDRYKRLS